MKKPFERERDDAQRLQTAAEWVLRLRDDAASEEEIVRWVHWCETDPRNQHAFERTQKLWEMSGELASEVVNGELVSANPSPGRTNGWLEILNALLGHRSRVAFGVACAAALVAGVAWLLHAGVGSSSVRDEDVVAVASAEPAHKATLSDGSVIELAAKSAVAVHYSEAERAIELQGGEAFFSVAPNKRRPFVVSASGVRIRAVGTAFNVRHADDRVIVTVADGTVDVYQGTATGRAVRVSAGSEVRWSAAGLDPIVASVNPANALGWREGRLEYTDEPLSGVIADLNRYSARPVIIRGDAIKNLHFSGTLLTRSTDEWLRALPGEFPVEVKEQDGAYLIQPRS